MSFIWPAMLASLLLLLPLGVLYVRTLRGRRARAARAGGFGVPQAAGAGPGWRRAVPPALFLPALLLLGLALARPQATVSLPRLEGTVVLVVDVSASMAADDVAPSRLEAARATARELVERRPETALVGVVAFSDGGLAVQAPTADQEALLAAVDRLSPQRGTSVGEGLLAALNAIEAAEQEDPAAGDGEAAPRPRGAPAPAAIVLLSDGENNARPDPLEVAALAAERGVRIFTVGVGTAAGATLQLDGFSVQSRLEEGALRQIAELTGGGYYGPQDSAGLPAIYDAVAARLAIRPEATEVTALFAGAGLLLLLAGGLCSFLWFNRIA